MKRKVLLALAGLGLAMLLWPPYTIHRPARKNSLGTVEWWTEVNKRGYRAIWDTPSGARIDFERLAVQLMAVGLLAWVANMAMGRDTPNKEPSQLKPDSANPPPLP